MAVEAAKFGTSVIANSKKYSDIAEKYGEQFASFWGCSLESAKKMLSNPKFLQIAKCVRADFSQYFINMDTHQMATFCKSLTSPERAKLAKRALDEGISIHDLDAVFQHGVSIFDKKHNKNLLKDLRNTSEHIQLIKESNEFQNGHIRAIG